MTASAATLGTSRQAAEAGMSTMNVYRQFGGVPELMREVIDFG